jgi:IS1 family transposase
VDEAYVKVAGRWRYVYRAIDQFGQVIDVFVSGRRDAKAAHQFFERAISATKVTPVEVTTDRAPAYPAVLEELLPAAWHRTDRDANNRVECDHGRLKARLRALRGLKEDRSAKVIIAGLGSYRTFGEDTTSWRWTSQRAAGWLSRSTSWPWRSDLNQGRELQHPPAHQTQQCQLGQPWQERRGWPSGPGLASRRPSRRCGLIACKVRRRSRARYRSSCP